MPSTSSKARLAMAFDDSIYDAGKLMMENLIIDLPGYIAWAFWQGGSRQIIVGFELDTQGNLSKPSVTQHAEGPHVAVFEPVNEKVVETLRRLAAERLQKPLSGSR